MRKIGFISDKVKSILNIQSLEDDNIYLGSTNIEHMQNSHPKDYEKYKDQLRNIVNTPDYVGINPKDSSLEYVKEFKIENEYVKVAVRVTTSNKYFARSMYILNNKRVENFINKGTLKRC